MIKPIIKKIAYCSLVLAVSACTLKPVPPPEKPDAYYWQRISASSSLYLKGPKVQQMLERDINSCFVELKELERLGAISRKKVKASPAGKYQGDVVTEKSNKSEETVRAVHLPYHDLMGCMAHKGWELIERVPYELSEEKRKEDRAEYIERIIEQGFQTKTLQRAPATY